MSVLKGIIPKEDTLLLGGYPAKIFEAVDATPTVEEVREYVREKGYSVDPETFVDFYASKGWVVGKSPMKDWRAAVRTWAKDRKEQTPPNRNPKIQAAYGFSTERTTVNYNEIAMQRAWQEG